MSSYCWLFLRVHKNVFILPVIFKSSQVCLYVAGYFLRVHKYVLILIVTILRASVGNSPISFSNESLVFCKQKSEIAIRL